jgi:2-oxoglutarate dehydrogenase E2 component (dihydrolipoamide succinyltransferase)
LEYKGDWKGDNYERMKRAVMEELRQGFRPEFLNRVDEIIVFHALSEEHLKEIVKIQLNGLRKRLAERHIAIEFTDTALGWLVRNGYDPNFGARPLKRIIQKEVETPLARKLAEENHVDLSQIAGTGPGHKVREQDVLAFVQARGAAKSNGVSAPASSLAATREKMTPLRQRIAQRLVQAQHTAAMLTTFNEVDMSAVMALRKTYKEDFEKKHGIGLGFMGFFVKAVVQGLQSFPLVNASIVEQGGELMIERHPTCDIAVAVSTPKGLVVPVLRRCETLSFSQIESGIKELAGKGRDGKLTLEDMSGGTFTITNGGVFGSLMSTPILNPPQSAILGMHAIKNRAVEDPSHPGQVAIRPMMYLAVSYDHRIIDGAEAVQFLVKIKQAIEDPQRLLLNV